jgi:hypothetical protein
MDTSDMAEQLTPIELNPNYMEQATNDHITPTNRVANYIELSKQANSFTRASDSLGTKLSRSFLISWRNSTQWRPLLLKGVGMIQEDIVGHPPYSTWTPTIVYFSFSVSLIVAQFTIFGSFIGS